MKSKLLRVLPLLLSISTSIFAQKSYTGNEAADRVQAEREKANKIFYKTHATPAEIEKGITILKNSIAFLDSLPIKEMAPANAYLWSRRSDVNRNLATGYALLNKKDSALISLEKMYANGVTSGVVNFLQGEPALNGLRDEPRYIAIIQKLNNQKALWQNTAFSTQYRPDIPAAEKIAGLSLLWAQAKYNFANFDLVNIDWNQTYLDYLPKVKNTKSTAEYYKVLINFYAQLKDGHSNVVPPDSVISQFYSRPPFRTELVEGRVFVNQVFSDSLYKSGIVPGLEIIKINQEPVISYAEKNVKPYQSSSTPQDMEIREFSYGLLSGPPTEPIVFEFKNKVGKIINRTINRTGYHDIKKIKTLVYETIGNIGYLTINDFEDDKIIKQLD
ncbi:hypothetical protein [Mucilaginibacter flavus]|uniref:hypothetical protein n=1 Tax=Mucilaginibacter flavus TaxID=931504 RepID=UPI0025B5789C|nr:hypothetical protein [Mucilaginibacter flavus]MDN3584131.1 hypothetical protein [Mucilaginibacter flavus]